MTAAVPGIEIANHGYPACMRRPDSEMHARDAVNRHQMGAETFIKFLMRALDEQVVIQRAEDGSKAEGIVKVPGTIGITRMQAITMYVSAGGNQSFEKSIRMAAGHRDGRGWPLHEYRPGTGDKRSDDQSSLGRMRTQYREGIAMAGTNNGGDVGLAGSPGRCGHDARTPPYGRARGTASHSKCRRNIRGSPGRRRTSQRPRY